MLGKNLDYQIHKSDAGKNCVPAHEVTAQQRVGGGDGSR